MKCTTRTVADTKDNNRTIFLSYRMHIYTSFNERTGKTEFMFAMGEATHIGYSTLFTGALNIEERNSWPTIKAWSYKFVPHEIFIDVVHGDIQKHKTSRESQYSSARKVQVLPCNLIKKQR